MHEESEGPPGWLRPSRGRHDARGRVHASTRRLPVPRLRLDARPMLMVRVRLNGVLPRIGARVAGIAERRAHASEQSWFELLRAGTYPAQRAPEARA